MHHMVNLINDENKADRFFAALSDTTRRKILKSLSSVETKTPRELANRLNISLPALAKHIRVLKNAGLIDCEKQGRSSQCFRIDAVIKEHLQQIRVFLFGAGAGSETFQEDNSLEDKTTSLWKEYRLSRNPLVREELLENFLPLATYAVVRASVSSDTDPKELMRIGKDVLEAEIDIHERLPTLELRKLLLEKIQKGFENYFRTKKISWQVPGDFLEKGESNVALARFWRIRHHFSRRLISVSPDKILDYILNELPDRERRILALLYMENRTLKEIGDDMGVTDARVSQIHAQAIRSIEEHFIKKQSQ